MKTKTTSRLFLVGAVMLISAIYHPQSASAQCMPIIKIDGNNIIADENNSYGLKLPSWLKAGQTLAKSQNVFSIAVIEFTVTGNSLDYSQNLCITTIQTVPPNKVWKIESVNKDATATILAQNASVTSFYPAGTYSFTPTCNGPFRVQVWGAGGGGGDGDNSSNCHQSVGGGGGGGGYSEGVFDLMGGTTYTVTVGLGGTGGNGSNCALAVAGGTSSVNVISISATGGAKGNFGTPGSGGTFGTGSGGQTNNSGTAGANGCWGCASGKGGDGAGGGGPGGASVAWTAGIGNFGNSPGGGGSGGNYANGANGGAGADGKVIISKSGGAATGSTSRDKLQVAGVINATVTTSCGYVVPAGYVLRLDGVTAPGAGTLYMSTTCATTGDRGSIYILSNTYSGYNGSPSAGWPYPMWFNAGTNFYFSNGNAYIHGVEYTID